MEYTQEDLIVILDQLVGSWDVNIRRALAEQGYGLETLVNDRDVDVRLAVARHGYRLDILLNDCDWRVRAEVARHGYGLDRLVCDRHSGVRIEVAKQRYGLDVLVDDDVWSVRETVAWQGYGLDKLMYDPVYCVREAVANQGYGLDVLVQDRDKNVRDAARFYLRQEEHKQRDRMWAEQGYRYHQDNVSRENVLGHGAVCSSEADGKCWVEKEFSDEDLMRILRKVGYFEKPSGEKTLDDVLAQASEASLRSAKGQAPSAKGLGF